jgi:hypothetical protein
MLLFVPEGLAALDEISAHRPPSRVGSHVVSKRLMAERHLDELSAGIREDVFDLVPPEPKIAIQEPGGNECRHRTIKLTEDRRSDLRLIQISVVDGESDRASKPRSFAAEALEQLGEGYELISVSAKILEGASKPRRVDAPDRRTYASETVQHEDRRAIALRVPKRRGEPREQQQPMVDALQEAHQRAGLRRRRRIRPRWHAELDHV